MRVLKAFLFSHRYNKEYIHIIRLEETMRINVYRKIFMPYIVNTTKRIRNRTMMINLNDNNIVAYFFQLFATINYNYDVFLEHADTVERGNEKYKFVPTKINNLGKKILSDFELYTLKPNRYLNNRAFFLHLKTLEYMARSTIFKRTDTRVDGNVI